MTDMELAKAVEYVKDRLYYVSLRSVPRERPSAHFFSIDDELVYWNFFLDFGPLNLGQLYRFCQILSAKLHDKAHAGKRIYYYSGTHSHKRTNGAFLISAYAMLYLGRSPEDAFRPFHGVYPPFPPFHDASPCVCTYNLTILDCLRGIQRARECKFFDFDHFDIDEYEHFEKVENGDLNWIVEGKFLAFAGPHDVRSSSPEGYYTHSPDDYIPYFKKMNVTLVVRLNKKYYNEKRFTDAGIDHIDMYYLDGSTPTDEILHRFIEVCEQTPGAVAVHCKAGLGRTGTCIGAYMMKHWGFTAAETIGWIRTCRPGSIIGPQQHYMKEICPKMWAEGEAYRRRRADSKSRSRVSADVDDTARMLKGMTVGDRYSSSGRASSGRSHDAYSGVRASASSSRPGRSGASAGAGAGGGGGGSGVGGGASGSAYGRRADSNPGGVSPSRAASSGYGSRRDRDPYVSIPSHSAGAAGLGSPGGLSVASDVSQGDTLLNARDRAKRAGLSPSARSPAGAGGRSPLSRATGSSSGRATGSRVSRYR